MAKSSKSRPTSTTKRPAPLEGNQVWRERSRVRKAGPTTRESSWWDRTPSWLQHALCVGFLLVVALGFFAPTTFGGKTLAAGDTVQWRATAQAMMEYEEETGRPALWSPNTYGGMPGYLISYPARVPGPDTALSFLRGLGLWPAVHFFALLVGMYLLVLFLTRSKPAGVLAAVAYGLSTYLPIILSAGHNTKFVALAFAPWLLLGFAALARRDPAASGLKSALLTFLFAIVAAVNLRAGHIQITYYVVIIAGVWWIAEGIAAVRGHQTKAFVLSTVLLLVGSALALAMVAQPYLAQWEYKAFTIRSAGEGGGLAWDYAMEWSQGAGELLTLLIADAYGGGQLYWGPKPFTAGPHYVGAIVIALALIGAVGVARRSVIAFAVTAVIMTLFALGEYLPLVNRPAFDLLPLFSSFRVPETWLAAVALLLALLAGWGAYYLVRPEATHEAEARKRRIALITFGALLLFLGGMWATGGTLAFSKDGEQQQIEMAAAQQFQLSPSDPQVVQAAESYLAEARVQRREAFTADAGRSVLFLLLAAGLVGLLLWRRAPGWMVLSGLALLVTIDLWGVGRRYFSDDTPALQRRSNIAAAIPSSAADDFIRARVDEAGGPGHFRVLPENPLANAQPSYYYESVGGYNAARLALIQTYFDEVLPDSMTGLNANALRVLGVRYVLSSQPLPGLRPVFRDPQTGQFVLEDSLALPRAYLADAVEVVADDDALVARLRSPETDLRQTALLSEPIQGLDNRAATSPADSAATASVRLDRYTPDEIVWRVQTDRPRLLVASELYYPAGWTARVGDQDAPIVRANFLARGVAVPAGEHIVTMRFEPTAHVLGVRVAWGAGMLVYLGALATGGMLWYRRGHPA